MGLLNTYTDEEKAALKEYRLPHEWHSMSSDHFVLGYRCNKALTEHLRLKEEECKQLQQDKAELVEALSYVTERFESHLTDKYYMTKDSLYGEGFACQSLVEANELLEKHKCD